MQDACARALKALSRESLQKILMKGSMRMIKYLIIAYPQVMGAPILDALTPTIRPDTLRVLIEEINRGQLLTPAQIHDAECEFLRIINDLKLLPVDPAH